MAAADDVVVVCDVVVVDCEDVVVEVCEVEELVTSRTMLCSARIALPEMASTSKGYTPPNIVEGADTVNTPEVVPAEVTGVLKLALNFVRSVVRFTGWLVTT